MTPVSKSMSESDRQLTAAIFENIRSLDFLVILRRRCYRGPRLPLAVDRGN